MYTHQLANAIVVALWTQSLKTLRQLSKSKGAGAIKTLIRKLV